MRIIRVEAIPISVPYARPIVVSLGVQVNADNIVIKIFTDEGFVGIGEVSPLLPAYTGETQSTALSVIKDYLGPALINEDPCNTETLLKRFDQVIYANYCAKAGVETALLDLKGKILQAPVYQLLGGRCRDTLPLVGTVGAKDMNGAINEALAYAEEGYSALKIKVGRDPAQDIERVKKIRQEVGEKITLQVDANQGYSTRDALKAIRGMEEYNLLAAEQPINRLDLRGMQTIRNSVNTIIIADEAVTCPEDIYWIAREGAADAVQVKVLKHGGLLKAKKIVAVSESLGLLTSGSFMLELGLGTAANAHFGISTEAVTKQFCCEFIGTLTVFGGVSTAAIKEDILKNTPAISGGQLQIPDGPGLGVELDDEKVDYYQNAAKVVIE
ncbi:MAG: hypothetical protein GX263_04600 [Firmicutes bacterium]|nr:hypothetical protein [Bacillota bacterium]